MVRGGLIKAGFVLALAVVMFAAQFPAQAELGTIDVTPAATVLLPYFEVDVSADGLENGTGVTTLFALTNTSAAPAVAHATLWTDMAVPTAAFDIQLTGFDVQVVNLRDIFNGESLDLGNTPIDFSLVAEAVTAAHTGQPSPSSGNCAAFDYGDNVARGYVTIDNMNVTGAGFPGDTGYFVNGGSGDASDNNVLWGEYTLVDPANNFAQGETMVHIEASPSDALVTTDGNYTFYGALVGGDASDNREPLASTWSAPYDQRAESSSSTQLIFWRDPAEPGSRFPCGTAPSWFPLPLTQVVAFDEAENPADVTSAAMFQLVCGRAQIGDSVFVSGVDPTFESGWIFLNLNAGLSGLFENVNQSFVSVVNSSEGRFSSGLHATALNNVSSP